MHCLHCHHFFCEKSSRKIIPLLSKENDVRSTYPTTWEAATLKEHSRIRQAERLPLLLLFQTRGLRGLYLIFPSSNGKNSLSWFPLIWLRREGEYVALVESFQAKAFKLKCLWSNRNYFIYLIAKINFFIIVKKIV